MSYIRLLALASKFDVPLLESVLSGDAEGGNQSSSIWITKQQKKHTEEVTSGGPQTRNPGIVGLQPPKRKRVYGTEVKRRKKARLQAEAANTGRSKSGPSSSGINSKGKWQATIANSKIPGGKRPQGQKRECGLQPPDLRQHRSKKR